MAMFSFEQKDLRHIASGIDCERFVVSHDSAIPGGREGGDRVSDQIKHKEIHCFGGGLNGIKDRSPWVLVRYESFSAHL